MPNVIGLTELFAHLHVASSHGVKAPHKAVLLLSVIDLIEQGSIDTPFVYLSDQLVRQFQHTWEQYVGNSPYFKPDITKPYYHLQYESFWRLIGCNKRDDSRPYDQVTYTIPYMRQTYLCACLDQWLFDALQESDVRDTLRSVLISTYLAPRPDTSIHLANLAWIVGLIGVVV